MIKVFLVSFIISCMMLAYIKAMLNEVNVYAGSHKKISNAFYLGIIPVMIIVTGINMYNLSEWHTVIACALGAIPIFIYTYMIKLFEDCKRVHIVVSVFGLICLFLTCIVILAKAAEAFL